MQLDAKSVSVDVSGDYYQVCFDTDDREDDQIDPFEQPAPYLLVQRQFEWFDGGVCYIESHDEEYVGHFQLTLIEFSPTRFTFEIARRDHKRVEVCCALTAAEFEKAQPVVEVLFGLREPSEN